MKAIVNETKKFNAAISGAGAHDSRALENIFEKCRHDKKKMTTLVRAFCEAYLVDNQNRPLKMRPLQESIVVTALTHPTNGKQRKMAILAPRGSGKSYALSIAATVYMFFKRFRDLIFILAPSEDQASLIFNYVYRQFADNAFLSGLVKNYRFHNKPNITLKGGTVLRRAPVAASNQGQAIRGQHPTFLIVDESPLIDDKLFIDNVEPCIVANKAPFINLGTPKSKENHMWRYLYDDAYADTFERLVFTWRDAVKAGRAYTPPYTETEMLDKMMEWGEDSIFWRTEYECEFVESVSNIFNPEAIKACRQRGTFFADRGKVYPNCTVAVDIGKSVNSTVISVWAVEKATDGNIARLISLEEINPRTGGHDIPFQRQRIVDTARDFGAERIIIDATGIGGAIEQDI
ncbi:MAG: terminase large subunit, partial [Gammaproteobacteria bacterium]|nr:terminase large subunit [Gammaproteobacteria bacterium]